LAALGFELRVSLSAFQVAGVTGVSRQRWLKLCSLQIEGCGHHVPSKSAGTIFQTAQVTFSIFLSKILNYSTLFFYIKLLHTS
jgi:hypothetical protein